MPAKRKNPSNAFDTKAQAKAYAAKLKAEGVKTKIRRLKNSQGVPFYWVQPVGRYKTNPAGVKMRKAPKGWIKAKAVRVVKRGGRTVVEVKR